jgi:hypothetical protein
MKETVSNCHAPLGYPYTRGDHCWRVTGTTAFAAALICRYPYDALGASKAQVKSDSFVPANTHVGWAYKDEFRLNLSSLYRQ